MDQYLIHVTIVLYCCLCLVMLNQGVLEVHKQFSRNSQNQFNSKFYLIQRNFQLVGCSDAISKLPIPVGSSVLLPTEPSRPNSFISSELPILYRNFRYPTEVSHYFRPGVLGRKFFEYVGSSDTPSELPTRPDPINTPL